MTDDEIALACAGIFRKTTGLNNTPDGMAVSDADILSMPIESFDIDSLETMEFIMAVEDHFGIELNEEAVNRCHNVAELAGLAAAGLRV